MLEGKQTTPILFFFGPSGAGKTTLAEWLKSDLGFLHLKIDRAAGDGIDIEGIRKEWNTYLEQGNALELAQTIRRRIQREDKTGAVLTFASTHWLKLGQIGEAERHGILTIILYGPKDDCLNSFLSREKRKKRDFGKNHWIKYNDRYYVKFTSPEYAKYIENTFVDHRHRSKNSLVEAIRHRIDSS
jgi:adenylate kinase family enzyme